MLLSIMAPKATSRRAPLACRASRECWEQQAAQNPATLESSRLPPLLHPPLTAPGQERAQQAGGVGVGQGGQG